MTENELHKLLLEKYPIENDNVEYKEFSNLKHSVSWDKGSIISYVSAFANWEWWKLIIWIEDEILKIKWIKKFAWYTIFNIKERILWNVFNLNSEKFEIIEIITSDTKKIIWIFDIPKHEPRKIVNANWKEYQRMWDNIIFLKEERRNYILSEDLEKIDWSGLTCKWTKIEDLDDLAIRYIREKLFQITNNKDFLEKKLINLLNYLWLLNNNIPNNTCILFLWKKEISDKFIKERNKISWKYTDVKNNIVERLNLEEQSWPIILTLEKIKNSINRFNTTLKDIDLFRTEVKQYDNDVIEELLVNGLVHRDWNILLWNEIVQTPDYLDFRNPWIFKPELNDVLLKNYWWEYLNPTMCNFFQQLWLMEKERWGLKLVYETQLKRWLKVLITKLEKRVDFRLNWKIQDEKFAKLVLWKSDIILEELLVLDEIVSWKTKLDYFDEYLIEKLLNKWLIEIRWTRYKKIYLSEIFSQKLWKTWDYIKKKWLEKQQMNMLIFNHIEKFWQIQLKDVKDMFQELTIDRQKKLLANLKKDNKISLIKNWKRSDWYYQKKDSSINKN